jgi:hypothetical protein
MSEVEEKLLTTEEEADEQEGAASPGEEDGEGAAALGEEQEEEQQGDEAAAAQPVLLPQVQYTDGRVWGWPEGTDPASVIGLHEALGVMYDSAQQEGGMSEDWCLASTGEVLSSVQRQCAELKGPLALNLRGIQDAILRNPDMRFCLIHGRNKTHTSTGCNKLQYVENEEVSYEQHRDACINMLIANPTPLSRRCAAFSCALQTVLTLQRGSGTFATASGRVAAGVIAAGVVAAGEVTAGVLVAAGQHTPRKPQLHIMALHHRSTSSSSSGRQRMQDTGWKVTGMDSRAIRATEGMQDRDMGSRATEGMRDRVMDPTGMAVTSSKVTTWSSHHSSGAHRQQQLGLGRRMQGVMRQLTRGKAAARQQQPLLRGQRNGLVRWPR